MQLCLALKGLRNNLSSFFAFVGSRPQPTGFVVCATDNSKGKVNGGKSKAGANDDKTRREWKGPVVWHPPEDNAEGATARRRSTVPGSSRARWGVEKRIHNDQLVIVPPT